jgi:hypothetical protein
MSGKKDHLARVRRICLALPEATEKTAWGAPTFRVGGRLFAMFADDHHGDGRIALWLYSKRDSQQLLVDSDPERFFIPPYVGPAGWIGIHVDRSNDALLADCAWRAWYGVAKKRLRARVEAERAGSGREGQAESVRDGRSTGSRKRGSLKVRRGSGASAKAKVEQAGKRPARRKQKP